MNKKNCLLVLPRPVFPVISGYAIKNKELIQILNEKYNLSLVIITNHVPSFEEDNFYKENSQSYKVFVFHKFRYLLNALMAFFGNEPLQVGYYYFKPVQRYIDNILHKQDIIIGALIRTIKYFPKNVDSIKVFDMVDSIALNYQRSLSKVKSFFWRNIYKIETKRLLRSEEYGIKESDITYLFNWQEVNYWKKFGNVHLLPHGVNNKLFSYGKYDEMYRGAVSFIGKMDYQPNIDAVLWYLKNVHPLLSESVPFYIVGAYPTKEIFLEAAKNKNVFVTGFVDDPYLIIKSSMAVVAPMQTGGGIQNKVLEAMALGKTVITTTLSATPILNARNNMEFIIANTPEEFVATINRLKNNPTMAEKIGENARTFIKENYTWNSYGLKYTTEIDNLLKIRQNQ